MLYEINPSKNGFLIFENIPPGTEVGIDYHAWYTGPSFKGISNITPGLHFVFFSTVDKFDEKSPRTGFFVFVKDGDVLFKIYDQENEDLKEEQEDALSHYTNNIQDIAKNLAPYPFEECKKWSSLTDYISIDLLQKIQPVCGKIDVHTEVPLEVGGKQKKSITNVDSRIEHNVDSKTIIRFTRIPSDFPKDATPQDISKLSIDSSYFLEKLIEDSTNGEDDILGELQLAFVMFLVGQVYDAFEHWKLLVNLFVNCHDALSSRSSLFLKFIDIIDIQMEEIPEDYFVDIAAQNNFLWNAFKNFFQNFDQPDRVNNDLIKKVSIFKHKLSSRFQWDLDEEDEEYMPVVVELL